MPVTAIGLFGWQIAGLYLVTGLAIAVVYARMEKGAALDPARIQERPLCGPEGQLLEAETIAVRAAD